jgi:hypothetical protein
MGKRSNFPLVPRDFYPTPLKAVQPLIPHLDGIRGFAEPCAGESDLVRHLESCGLRCVYQGDIATGRDALDLTSDDIANAPIITNPPFSRESQPLLRRMLVHFLHITSTVWLLLPADFASNQWFAPFLPQCSDIVAFAGPLVRRHEGQQHGELRLVQVQHAPCRRAGLPRQQQGRRGAPRPSRARQCEQCSRPYRPLRADSRFCDANCRHRAHRERISRDIAVTNPEQR